MEAQVLTRLPGTARTPRSASSGGRPNGAVQLALIVTAWLVYFGIRAISQGSTGAAERHAHDIVRLERTLGVHREEAIQGVALRHEAIVDIANWVYIWGHWPVIAITALWLWHRVPGQYVTLRNAMFLSGGVGMLLFLFFPVAPPRLAHIGLVDSVTLRSHAYRALQPPSLTNEYAAFPSLHFGWDLLVGITLVRAASRPWLRVIGAVLPVAMALAVVATANHYLVDVAGGGLIALSSLVAVELLQRRRRQRPWQRLYLSPEPQGQGSFRPTSPPNLAVSDGSASTGVSGSSAARTPRSCSSSRRSSRSRVRTSSTGSAVTGRGGRPATRPRSSSSP
jgi:membrane-associated phospholipid phosphatase